MKLSMTELFAAGPVIPVLTIPDAATAVPLAKALGAGGLTVLEVTLRTAAALDAIRAIKRASVSVLVGAGTVLSPQDMEEAVHAGADFLVSPGATRSLIETATRIGVPYLPGASTASEIMTLREAGYRCQKFFPAEQSGGVAALKALYGPLPDVVFCPTGGVGTGNAAAYLGLANVAVVGGSWPAPNADIRAGAWDRIEQAARQAASIERQWQAQLHAATGERRS